jgi:cyclic pyranopterin phosphate synthase
MEAGLHPVKLNCVVMRGWNEDEILDFAQLSLDKAIDVRFIELMPINWSAGDDSPQGSHWSIAVQQPPATSGNRLTLYANADLETFRRSFQSVDPTEVKGQLDANQMRRAFVGTDEIRSAIELRYGAMAPSEVRVNGPARSFKIPGASGTISFISQITNDMCVNCNRLRLTADGQLRPCLMADGEVDLRTQLRSNTDDEQLAELFRITVLHKPAEHRLEDGLAPIGRNMSQLGG